ncbi:MAG: CHASE domain-containing protein [Leptolyngbyaceae cyanobacterium]
MVRSPGWPASLIVTLGLGVTLAAAKANFKNKPITSPRPYSASPTATAIYSSIRQPQTTKRDRAGQLVPAALRPSYVPITFLEPKPTNEVALGFDLASDPIHRIVLERARDTGAIEVHQWPTDACLYLV